MNDRALTRSEQKQQTRRALLDAALAMLEDESFSGLSLRRLARAAGIVPTAFYRHFDSIEELGLVLIEEAFRTLREMLRTARTSAPSGAGVIEDSVAILVAAVREHEPHFRLIARERSGGVTVLRRRIHDEIRLFASELATDLARFEALASWSTEDLQLLASLFVDAMVATAEALLETQPPESRALVIADAQRRLRLIVVGVSGWRSAR